MFRTLKANEIECRVSTVTASGVSLLLYKDARCDMNILDETVGSMNWKRTHTRDNANCIVELWDSEKKQWISKEDTGSESFTEKEKGLASDSFKRSCFNWGIGRELYTAPFIWIFANECNFKEVKGKKVPKEKFHVAEIGYDEQRNINLLVIANSKDKPVFSLGKDMTSNDVDEQLKPPGERLVRKEELKALIEHIQQVTKRDDVSADSLFKAHGLDKKLLNQKTIKLTNDQMKLFYEKIK